MDWFAPVDIYCERMDPSFWAEPLNAISNAAFILAALWAAITARQTGTNNPAVWLLIVLAFCIGIGSFLFHTYANVWSGFADTVPIWTFVATYILVSIALIGGAPPGKIAIGAILVTAIVVIVTIANDSPADYSNNVLPKPPSRFNGSEQYLPAVIAMVIFSTITLFRGHPIRFWFLSATIIFFISLVFRTFDMTVCANWPYGTHFMWHMLNGTMIALLLQGLIRNTQRTPTL